MTKTVTAKNCILDTKFCKTKKIFLIHKIFTGLRIIQIHSWSYHVRLVTSSMSGQMQSVSRQASYSSKLSLLIIIIITMNTETPAILRTSTPGGYHISVKALLETIPTPVIIGQLFSFTRRRLQGWQIAYSNKWAEVSNSTSSLPNMGI